jgi:putative ABC transport system permease protein
LPIGQSIRVNGTSFEIIGVMAQKGSNLGLDYDDAVLLPITTQASRLVGRRQSPYGIEVSFISVSTEDRESMSTAAFQITNLLRLRHDIRGEDDFFIQSQDTLLSIAETITGALTVMLAAIAGISLLVGGIGIMNIMLVSVRTGLGIGGIVLIGVLTPFEAGVSGAAIAIAVGVSGGIGLFFGVFPARQAAKLDPIVALRSA